MIWLGFVAALALLLAYALWSAARAVADGRAWREFFRSYAEDWRTHTIEVVIVGAGKIPIVTHGRTHAFSVRTARRETIAFPEGFDLITVFVPSPKGPTLVLPAGHRCGLYISTGRVGVIRVGQGPHMVLHTLGWSPYAADSGYPRHWRWSGVAIAIAVAAALAVLVAWFPAWFPLGWIALALFARDLVQDRSRIVSGLVV